MKQPLFRKFEFTIALAAVVIWFLRWPLLQLIAWSKMLIQYSVDFGFREGINMTFSGEHPCALCHAVQTGVETDATILSTPFGISAVALVLFTAASGSFITRNLFKIIHNER